mmetsp:Transcript_17114/g.37513  ORF Transcript_17114/g.37513 Transcript_17114/m.37513 type:complete len:124 (-) Transcript_17114:96-467(-)
MRFSIALAVAFVAVTAAGGVLLRREAPAVEAKQPPVNVGAIRDAISKLKGTDPKTFQLLSGVIDEAEGKGTGAVFLQLVGPEDDPKTAEKLQALQPVLEKLKGLDSKTFGLLSGLMAQATTVH